MLLRRFFKHMKQQNWSAVGLDVIVVIVGIFLGLQITEWYEERIEQADEKVYLQRILVDLEQSDRLQIQQIERLQELDPVLDVIVRSFHNKQKYADFDRSFVLSQIQQGASARPLTVFVTIEELKSAGKFNLIRSSEIRNAIGQLQQSYELTMDLTNNRQRFMAEFLPTLSNSYTTALRTVNWETDLREAAKGYIMDESIFANLANDDAFVTATGWAAGLNSGQMEDLIEHNGITKQLAIEIKNYLVTLD